MNKLRYADDTTLMAKSEEELKSLLMKVKEKNRKAGSSLQLEPCPKALETSRTRGMPNATLPAAS